MKRRSLIAGAMLGGFLQFVVAICFFRFIRNSGSLWWGDGFSFGDFLVCCGAGALGGGIGVAASATRRPMFGAAAGAGLSLVAYGATCVPFAFVASISANASNGEVNHLVNGTIAMIIAGMTAGGIGAATAKQKDAG